MLLLLYSNEIRNAVLIIHGEKAHSQYFSEDAFKKLKGKNKGLLIIPNASQVDLYDDKVGVIPYDKSEKEFWSPPDSIRNPYSLSIPMISKEMRML